MTSDDYSKLYAVLRNLKVVHRESFTLATYHPTTYRPDGGISAHDFAHEVLRALDRCRDDDGFCAYCEELH